MSHGFDKYELPSRVALCMGYYVGRSYETSDDVLADRQRLIDLLTERLSRKVDPTNAGWRIGAAELRRDLIAGHPRGAVTLQAIKQMEK
jgi:hypothetical protein